MSSSQCLVQWYTSPSLLEIPQMTHCRIISVPHSHPMTDLEGQVFLLLCYFQLMISQVQQQFLLLVPCFLCITFHSIPVCPIPPVGHSWCIYTRCYSNIASVGMNAVTSMLLLSRMLLLRNRVGNDPCAAGTVQ